MNYHQKLLFAGFISLLIFTRLNLILASPLSKSYSINLIEIEADVLPDGSLLISESRSYTFRGKFSWADYTLPLNKSGRVTDFELNEDGLKYHRGLEKAPGTYSITPKNFVILTKYFKRYSCKAAETQRFRKGNP